MEEKEESISVSVVKVHVVLLTMWIMGHHNKRLPTVTHLHEYTHDPPAVVWPTLWESLVQRHSCLLLFLVVPHSDVGHEQVCQDLLIFGVVFGRICIQLCDLLDYCKCVQGHKVCVCVNDQCE